MNNGPVPLDPEEGPTIWADRYESNKYTYRLIIGTDPEDPREVHHLSQSEIKTLCRYVKEHRVQ